MKRTKSNGEKSDTTRRNPNFSSNSPSRANGSRSARREASARVALHSCVERDNTSSVRTGRRSRSPILTSMTSWTRSPAHSPPSHRCVSPANGERSPRRSPSPSLSALTSWKSAKSHSPPPAVHRCCSPQPTMMSPRDTTEQKCSLRPHATQLAVVNNTSGARLTRSSTDIRLSMTSPTRERSSSMSAERPRTLHRRNTLDPSKYLLVSTETLRASTDKRDVTAVDDNKPGTPEIVVLSAENLVIHKIPSAPSSPVANEIGVNDILLELDITKPEANDALKLKDAADVSTASTRSESRSDDVKAGSRPSRARTRESTGNDEVLAKTSQSNVTCADVTHPDSRDESYDSLADAKRPKPPTVAASKTSRVSSRAR